MIRLHLQEQVKQQAEVRQQVRHQEQQHQLFQIQVRDQAQKPRGKAQALAMAIHQLKVHQKHLQAPQAHI